MTLEECEKLKPGNIITAKICSHKINLGIVRNVYFYKSPRCREAVINIKNLDNGEDASVGYRNATLINASVVILTEDDCYCSIVELYEKVAGNTLKKSIDSGQFDCKKICVTPGVIDMMYKFYETEKGMSRTEITTLLLIYGPKGNLDISGDCPYMAKLENGFYVENRMEGVY